MEKMKILEVCDSFYPNVDGVVNTVDNYARLLNRNNECKVIIPNYPDYDLQKSYKVIRSKSVKFKKNKYRVPTVFFDKKNRIEMTKFKADIIHAHSPFVLGHYVLMVAKLKKIPIVTTFHSKYYDDFMQTTKSQTITKGMMNYIMNFYKHVDEVWACSDSTAMTLRSYGYKGPIMIMENGTNYEFPDKYDLIKSLAIKKFSIDVNKNIILFVGAFIWQKNIKLVIDTLKELIQDNFDFQMIMVGAGNNEDEIIQYAKTTGVYEHIIFTGKILDVDLMKSIYLNSDLFFFPSVYDNAPLVLREASAMRIPSLLTEGANASEVVTNNVNGYCAPENAKSMAKKIQDVFSNKNSMKEIGLMASKTIPVSWDEIVDKVEERYKKIIKHYKK